MQVAASEPIWVLVVEDEYLLAMDLEQALTGAGFATQKKP
jgi:hypothetical protein